ncbi:MAG: hypothetical protein ABJB12_14000 [Pseudomonadota bacterium]
MTFRIFASLTERRLVIHFARASKERARRLVYRLAVASSTLLIPLGAAAEPASKTAQLPELPAIPSIELGRPAAADLEELDARLAKLCSADEGEREAARREALEVDAKSVAAIRFRLASTSESTNHDDLKELLQKLRKKGRDDARDENADSGKRGKVKTPDYLEMAAEHAEPKSKLWCSLVSVLAESRMLTQIGSVEAVRGLIDVYVRYGEFLRVDTQLQLEALGDRAVPALIEARRHPAEKIAKWAARELDTLGKAIPSETVQTTDLQVLADVLRAYGRVRDPDAARIVVSFANSERSQIREASRQAIAMFGEVGAWQLRDTYEDVVGKKPPRDWNWERTARELFGEFDRLRSAEVSKLYDAGVAARARGDLEAMRKAFDQVLTRTPDYPKHEELAAAYLQYAQTNAEKGGPELLSALRRAERLGKGTELEKTAISLRLTLEAQALSKSGIADRTLLSRALEADPKNSRAQRDLSRFQSAEVRADDSSRYLAAGAIGFVALGGIAFVLLRRETTDGSEKPTPSADLASGAPPEPEARHAQPTAPSQEPTQAAAPAAMALSAEASEAEAQNANEPTAPEGDVSSDKKQ